MVCFPFGAPQAESVTAPARSAAVAAPIVTPATASRPADVLSTGDLATLRRQLARFRCGTPQD
jgi:hypothetical protein